MFQFCLFCSKPHDHFMPSEGYNQTGVKYLNEKSKLIIYTFKIVFLQSKTYICQGNKPHFVRQYKPINKAYDPSQYICSSFHFFCGWVMGGGRGEQWSTTPRATYRFNRSISSSGWSPVINPVCQCTYVPTNILHVVASHGHDNVLFVALPRLLQEHLEDLALYVV